MSATSEASPVSVDRLGAVVVKGMDGAERPLKELWADRPVVFSFVRHFG